MPQPPKLVDMTGLEGDELQQARSQIALLVIQYYTGVQRHLDKQAQELKQPKFAEDIHSFTQSLKAPLDLEMSALTPEEQAFVTERRESVLKRFDEVKGFIVNAPGNSGGSGGQRPSGCLLRKK